MKIKINKNKCVGCRTCELVCSFHNYQVSLPELSHIRIFFDNAYNVDIRISSDCTCKKNPPCVLLCPTQAITFRR